MYKGLTSFVKQHELILAFYSSQKSEKLIPFLSMGVLNPSPGIHLHIHSHTRIAPHSHFSYTSAKWYIQYRQHFSITNNNNNNARLKFSNIVQKYNVQLPGSLVNYLSKY